jgi:hypothetical protein
MKKSTLALLIAIGVVAALMVAFELWIALTIRGAIAV